VHIGSTVRRTPLRHYAAADEARTAVLELPIYIRNIGYSSRKRAGRAVTGNTRL